MHGSRGRETLPKPSLRLRSRPAFACVPVRGARGKAWWAVSALRLVGVVRCGMSGKPLPVESVAQENEEGDPVAAAFDNAPFMEATPAMMAEILWLDDGADAWLSARLDDDELPA